MLELPAHKIEQAIKVQTRFDVCRALDERLPDGRHAVKRLLAQGLGTDGNLAPCQKLDAPLIQNDLEVMHELYALDAVLREEEHAHAEVAVSCQGGLAVLRSSNEPFFYSSGVEEICGNLQDDAHAVACLASGVFAGTMLELLYDA